MKIEIYVGGVGHCVFALLGGLIRRVLIYCSNENELSRIIYDLMNF